MQERISAAKDLSLSGALISSPMVGQLAVGANLVILALTAIGALIGLIVGWIRLRKLIAGGDGPWYRRLWNAMFGEVHV